MEEYMSRKDNRLASARKMGDVLGRQYNTKNSIGKSDTLDFHQFTVSQAVDFSLSFRRSRASAQAKVDLLSSSGAVIIKGGKRNQISGELGAGTYYIRVKSLRGNTQYSLTVSASLAEPGETSSGSRNVGILSGELRIQDFVGTTDPSDYYKFTLSQISTFNANIDGLSGNGVEMNLYFDANKNNLIDDGESLDYGRDGNSISRTMLPGTYFLTVDPYYSSESTEYNLFISATPDPSNLAIDPGNSETTAFPLGDLSTASLQDFVGAFNRIDYYKFTLSQISNFNANIDGLSGNGVEMNLYFDANKNGLIDDGESLDYGRDGNNISRTMLPGAYFLTVDPYYSSESTRYDLFVSATPNPGNLFPDPGNRTTTAYDLDSFTGTQTLQDFVGAFNSIDYYKFTVNGTSNFNANIDGLTGNGVEMNLYLDANKNNLIDNGESVDYGRDNDNISRTISAGTYFLTVDPYYSSESTRYNLSVEIS
jgi:hypothetical protein